MDAEDSIIYKDIYRNAYFVLTGVLSVDDLLEYNGCVLPFEPYSTNEEIKENVYNDIINYFIELEEYEKCGDIKKIKDTIYNKKKNVNFVKNKKDAK
tara:strand:- start:3683 stop:3973 length:291 start_codon:yes stop_codon:yes gene_type:complete